MSLAPFLDAIRPGGEGIGFLHKFRAHSLAFTDQGTRQLVVTFDNLAELGDTSLARGPWSHRFFHERGCSVLGVMARRGMWFRDPELIAALQALAAQGFFARFERVLMTGNSMGGFGALAFAPLAPGCNVLAFSPQSTLDRTKVPFEDRYERAWGNDWTLPYSDAAEGAEAAGRSWLIHDPLVPQDRAHAARIVAPQVEKLEAWYASHKSPVFLRRIGILKAVSEAALEGSLSARAFHALYRARRETYWYRNALVSDAQARGHPRLAELARARGQALQDAAEAREAAALKGQVKALRRDAAAARDGLAVAGGPAIVERAPKQDAAHRIALIGLTHEGDPFMPRWLDWHGRHLAPARITLLHRGAAPHAPGCTLIPCGADPWPLAAMLADRFAEDAGGAAILASHEFLVLDPEKGENPFAFAMAEDARAAIAPFGIEIVHHRGAEPDPLGPGPLLAQRGHFQLGGTIRPAIAKRPMARAPGGHGDTAHPNLSEELFIFSLALADHDLACRHAALTGGDAAAVSCRIDAVSQREAEERGPLVHWAQNRANADWLAARAKGPGPVVQEPFSAQRKLFRLPEAFRGLF